jgi:hypothetical protein
MSGTVRISTAIMTHPRRRRQAEALARRCADLNPVVVLDPEPDAAPSALRSARLAWDAAEPAATHHLVLQDDAVPCPGFGTRLTAAVEAQPDAALALFVSWGSRLSYAVRLAALCGFGWTEVVERYMPTVALVMPAGAARDMASFLRTADGTDDDEAVLRYLSQVGLPAYAAVPSLVDHRDLPSLTGHDFRGIRRAVCMVSPLQPGVQQRTEWAGSVLRPDAVPFVTDHTGRAFCHFVRETPGLAGEVVRAPRLLRERGLPADHLCRTLNAFLRGAEAELLADAVGWGFLYELWMAAHLLGALAIEHRADDQNQPDPLAAPLARAALSTMGLGALRRLVPYRQLEFLAESLTSLLFAGVQAGAQAGVRADARTDLHAAVGC